MLQVTAVTVSAGVEMNVRAVCSGLTHMGDRCTTRAVRTLMPSSRVESLGYALALEETMQDVWVQYPGLLELVDH